MAKRFTDTNKWKKPFIKNLPSAYKLFWFFLLDDCDHAGIWQVDFEGAILRTGEDLKMTEAIKIFKENVVVFDGGEKWFIPAFIEFQYGELNDKNRVHESILKILNKYKLLEIKPLTSPLQGAKDKDKEEEQDNKIIISSGNFLVQNMHAAFTQTIKTYTGDTERDFKPLRSIAEFICTKIGKENILTSAEEILNEWKAICLVIKDDNFYSRKSLSSISNNIQEIIQPKNGKAIKGTLTTAGKTDMDYAGGL